MSEATTPVPVAAGTTHYDPNAQTPAPDQVTPPVVTAPVVPAEPAKPVPVIPAPAADGKLEETGDPGLDLAIGFINDAGIKANDPAVEAARNGDFTLIEAKLAALGDKAKGYDKFIALAKAAYEKHTETVNKTNAEVESMVHAACGGAEGWAAVSAWAGKEASPAEKEQINAAFAAGGVQARAAANYLAEAYKRAGRPGYREPTPAIKPGAAAGGANEAPLTAKAYAAEVQKLIATAKGRSIDGSAEYRALQARRQQSRAAGY